MHIITGTDEESLINVLAYRSSPQRAQIVSTYKTMFGKVSKSGVSSLLYVCIKYVISQLGRHILAVEFYINVPSKFCVNIAITISMKITISLDEHCNHSFSEYCNHTLFKSGKKKRNVIFDILQVTN